MFTSLHMLRLDLMKLPIWVFLLDLVASSFEVRAGSGQTPVWGTKHPNFTHNGTLEVMYGSKHDHEELDDIYDNTRAFFVLIVAQ